MSTALLFDLDEVAPVRAPAPPPPSAPAVRRRLTVVEQPALPLPEPEVKEPPTKADAQQLYHWRSGKVSLALLGEAPGRYDVDRFEMTHGECMVQRRRCRFTDCDHHLGGVRKFEHPDYPNRRYTFSCALAVARHFPKGLAPKYVAELLGTSPAQARNMVGRGQLVKPLKVPGLGLRWRAVELLAWIKSLGGETSTVTA